MPDTIKRLSHIEKYTGAVLFLSVLLFFQVNKIWRRLTCVVSVLKSGKHETQIECWEAHCKSRSKEVFFLELVLRIFQQRKAEGLQVVMKTVDRETFGLGNTIMVANFQSSGKYANLRAALNKTVNRTIALFGRHLASSAVIKS